MDDLIRRKDVLALSKDVTLKNGAKHRCVDTTEINLLPSVHQWIPCSERLPEEGKEVLISSDDGLYIAELEILEGNVYWNETIEYRSVKRVSAWMPLPKPYEAERKEE